MSVQSMDVFSLRDAVVGEYKQFATSFTTIFAEDIRTQVDAIYNAQRYWPEPLIQINPKYKSTTTVDKLVSAGTLDARCAEMFRAGGESLTLYKHQEQAIALASQGASYVVTTGTGSGKSLCFFIPIVNAVLAEKRRGGGKRTRAIVVYPMNALANSQLEELDKFVQNVQGDAPITFARYTGQEADEVRRRVAENPPDILLTNFMMLELLMTRQEEIDRRVIGNCAGLQFLVLDELHTYRGRQGADVALLVRRVRERLSPERLQCIGTSATMASEGTLEDKNRVVAQVASRLFAANIPESNVVVETLERVTDANLTIEKVRPKLGAAIDAVIPSDVADDALRKNPLAVWVETRLGISWSEADQRWQRAQPLTVSEAVKELSEYAARDIEQCRTALRNLLLVSSVPEDERTGRSDASSRSFFAFKLHQFISGAGHAYATLEPAGQRVLTADAQQFLPSHPEKRLYALHFCRECGHEYHPVRLVKDGAAKTFYARDIDDAVAPRKSDDDTKADQEEDSESDGEEFGFLTLQPSDTGFTFADRDEDYPENWVEFDARGTPRLKSHYRIGRARPFNVASDGAVGGDGVRAWFMPGKFRLCLRCGETQTSAAKDRTRLASLSAEGRSSATTVLVSSALRWMHGSDSDLEPTKRKLLGFTDNRQDAALQSGHFNDFLFVSLIRAAFLGALDAAGTTGLSSDELGSAQQKALGFDRGASEIRAEWLQEPTLRGLNLQDAEASLRQVLSYRVWFDQRRGWRYTNPNLEELELVNVVYKGIDELSADDELFASAPAVLRGASPAVRAAVYRKLLDHLRKWMAIRSQVLDPTTVDQMLARSHSRLRAPWGFGIDEKPRRARWLTANDEERQRQGFELQTTFEWAERDGVLDVRKGVVGDDNGAIVHLAYGPGATITRLNKGLRRRADRTQLGFKIDPISGFWAKNEDEDDGKEKDPAVAPPQWIVPCVQDHKNALLLQPSETDLLAETVATLQHALQRGIEERFQLEEGEILAEPMPTREKRTGVLLYEATEGGAGVLTRLVAEPTMIAEVALAALRIMHFDIEDVTTLPADQQGLKDAQDTECVAACYRCLMSYYNQPDHERIDRRDAKARELLLRLARARTSEITTQIPRVSDRPTAAGIGADAIPAQWFEIASAMGLPRQDQEPLDADGLKLPLVWRQHYVAACFGDLANDVATKLGDRGFEVIAFAESAASWDEPFRQLAAALGRGR